MDCDQSNNDTCGMDTGSIIEILQQSIEKETDLLRTYTIASERIHDHPELKDRLQNFAEGNAKRSRQLIDELKALEGNE